MSIRNIVVRYFKTLPGVNATNHFTLHLPKIGCAFVKYSGCDDIFGEAETQGFFYHLAQDDLAQDDPSSPRIPKVHAIFCGADGDERYFLVMEYVAAPTLEE
jgi:hypothetical protein